MTHTGPPKQVVFDPDSVDLTYISIGKIIAKGVADHASKAYEFSHFLPYSDPVQPQLPFERGGKNIISTTFANDVLSNVSDSEYEEQDQHDIEIEIEPQEDLDPNPTPFLNQNPKWAQNLIEVARNVIAKGVAKNASKAYEFSHFFPYSNTVQSQFPFKMEGKFILPKPFAYDDVSINVSYSESEEEDKVESVFVIKDEFQSYPYSIPYSQS